MSTEYKFKYQITLGQRLGSKDQRLQTYALNTYSIELAVLKMLMNLDRYRGKTYGEFIFDLIKEAGEAEGVKLADVLTQLGIKVGRTIRRVRVGKV